MSATTTISRIPMTDPIAITGLPGPAPSISNSTPTHYRLAWGNGCGRAHGLILQGWFVWTEGAGQRGEWRDIPAVDANDATPPEGWV